MIHVPDVARLVELFSDPADQSAHKSRELTLLLLDHTSAPLSRSQFIPGHITATGLVLHPERNAVLLIHHRRLERWLLPGGHVEPEDPSIYAAARREVLEETGLDLPPAPEPPFAGLDVHGIPPGKREPLHYHHDLIFAFRAVSPILNQGEEVREARWFEFEALPPALPDSIRLTLHRALRVL